ncbi:amidohydrolase family protein [Salidesulfovibrio onnuriiensis]|uniref:amidohydrolase family protein n=1 Tax=Salidesulfovibrio onnuriiensis TaxID=2583823 RepID=UPI00202B96CB|nr:amidohydrolase family protein [Salidesulfovibrio onnuriiensis]
MRARRAFAMPPEQPVIDDAAIITDKGVICEVGRFADLRTAFSGTVTDLGDVTLAPGLINAHSHLELCHLRGRTIPDKGFMVWVEDLLRQPIFDLPEEELAKASRELKRTGTVMVADIATRFPKRMAGFLEESGFFFVVFTEAIGEAVPEHGFIPEGDYDHGVGAVAGHSLYTTHVDVLRAAKAESSSRGLPFSIHLAEHDDEVAIMAGEPSPFLELLQGRGRLLDFEPPRKAPVRQAADLGILDASTLCVHCVKVSQGDIETIRQSGASVCLCPRSNEFIGVGRAPWEKICEAGINTCLGTDSLASNHDLDLWNEAAYFKERYQGGLSLAETLAMLTSNPARILGVGDTLGSLAPGKAAVWSVIPDSFQELFDE